ncbi:pyridoxamine 5'-phosphate oxidase [Granulosicoccaceae sp. 1_MG-2023]|nr:pyridoxamine 5'-phosphate oxidase [Granulosicoccaceae sp. 1_MG-2023]
MSKILYDERRDYDGLALRRTDLSDDPHTLFDRWLSEARDAGIIDATAMTLATVSEDGLPSARIVLLKSFDSNGFVFFTNMDSAKGGDLTRNPVASLLFYWRDMERQVRINGSVSHVSREEAEHYFHQRPTDSRFSAVASKQSEPVAGRDELEARVAQLHREFPDGNVPCPPSWGGYRVRAETIEFWQGRPNRLHDRFVYARDAQQAWHATRLCP